ncbi:ATP-binding protein [Desulfosarcina sp.]|uniref:ATP-binding protein n=1 Tax=Desulfosarcina sp. TaxID=2027861 RepID=UPI003970A0AD
MTIVPRRRLYLTACSILLVALLLLVFISVSTYRNLDRERDAAKQTVHRQALTLINALEAGARAGMMMQMAGIDAIGNLVHEIGRSGDVNYLYLVDAAGVVVHHAIPSLEGTRALWRPEFNGLEDVRTRVRRLPDGIHVYEVAKPFTPFNRHLDATFSSGSGPAPGPPVHDHSRATVYLGMTLAAFEATRQADLQHAMIMGGIVMALGGGIIYFFIVIRSYYLLSRTLQETRDYTRQVIASMAHGVLSIDPHGRVVSWNQQALALLGIAPTSIDHTDLQTVFDFEETGIARTLDAGIPVLNREVRYHRNRADWLPLLLTVTPIQDEAGSRSGAVVVLRDMRAIKRLEERVRRAERLAAVGRLAAGVAHEIRNPLSSIRGFAYLLGRGRAKDTPEREYADVMVREIDRINHVVTDLLNFSRPMTLEPEPTNLFDLVDHVVSLVSADAKSHGIAIRIAIDPGIPRVSLDPNQITQALLNLMLNAVNAMETGGSVAIEACMVPGGQGVEIRVEDSGPGIDPDVQEKIFEPFYTSRERGTGLGLAIVRKIAENHDGGVEVESPPAGKASGTRFTLFLRNMEANP